MDHLFLPRPKHKAGNGRQANHLAEWRNIDRYPDTDAKNRASEVFQALDIMDGTATAPTMHGGIPAMRFSSEAQYLFDSWHAGLEPE